MRRLVVVLGVVAACGPSKAEIRAARSSAYQTEFANVWNAVYESVIADYPRLVIEDPIHGRLRTDWHLIERVDLQDSSLGSNPNRPSAPNDGSTASPINPSQGQTQNPAQDRYGGRFFRMVVIIRAGGPPWRVEVEGEAALYRPGMAMITPYKHGDADEPPWVKTRIDKVRVNIYKRLKPYARVVVAKTNAKPRGRERDVSMWDNLPAEAIDVIADVRDAADKKDTAAIEKRMIEEFVWSVGGTPGVQAAVSYFNADPLVLSKLRDSLNAGCALRDEGAKIVCPVEADAQGAWRAEFVKLEGGWKFAAFYVNE